MGAAADEDKDVAPEQHLDDADAADVDIPAEDLAEWVAVEDPEPSFRAGGEVTVILVEGEVEEVGRPRRWRKRKMKRRRQGSWRSD